MRTQSLDRFCSWLEQTPLSQAIQSTGWVVSAVQTIHILAIAVVLSAVLMPDLDLLGKVGREQPFERVTSRFRPVSCCALPNILATGVVMIIGEPARSLANPVFQLKILLPLAAIAVTAGLHKDSRIIAILSLSLWVGIVFAGRWIAYS